MIETFYVGSKHMAKIYDSGKHIANFMPKILRIVAVYFNCWRKLDLHQKSLTYFD